jgi:SlyX protein
MERRMEEVEVKVAYLENLIEELDAVVRLQADRLDALQREIVELRDELPGGEALEDERPPHY